MPNREWVRELMEYAEKTRSFVPRPGSHKCLCGFDLSGQPIMRLRHRDPPWYFVHCPRCGEDMALWKLRVPEEGIE